MSRRCSTLRHRPDREAPGAHGGTLALRAASVLSTADPAAKASLTRALAQDWRAQGGMPIGAARAPERPARPDRPALLPPRAMPKRGKAGTPAGRIALLHAVAHIELNAIDLACDLLCRFADPALPQAFFDDWIAVADDEARHFGLLSGRLRELGAAYGDLPAHDTLWDAARGTAHDLLARLAVVPLVLEARGLDVTPAMIERLQRAGDAPSAAILHLIHEEEIAHVAAGRRWFEHVCGARGLDPQPTYRSLVRRHVKGALKRPFNREARDRAGLAPAYYDSL